MAGPTVEVSEQRPQRRLILCFDGTGNDYQARPNDTNIVKLLEMFDRASPDQMHYYQPGIGTYTADSSVNQSFLGGLKSNVTKTIDTGLGTSFDHHVMAGYRFLMRYHSEGERIYVFGFSRGAFTARFLARMIAHVGLLSKGNEEMVPFAYKLYQDYEMDSETWHNYMIRFRNTFCRHNSNEQTANKLMGGFKVHFLGLFDTVSSVGTLERGTVKPPVVQGTSRYVRHAVAIDERRVKFKASLLAQETHNHKDNIKEVWFPGNHGDVGGGWYPEQHSEPQGFFRRFWNSLTTGKDNEKEKIKDIPVDPKEDSFQLSDIALKWMIDELDATDKTESKKDKKRSSGSLAWSSAREYFLNRYADNYDEAMGGKMHDTMAFGGGSAIGKVLLWNFMEYLPGIWRYEYYNDIGDFSWWSRMMVWIRSRSWMGGAKYDKPIFPGWHKTYFPFNMGGCRDIVAGSLVHHSVIQRMDPAGNWGYFPRNQVFKGATDSTKASEHQLHEAKSRLIDQGENASSSAVLYFKEQGKLKTGDLPSDTIYSLEVDDGKKHATRRHHM